MTADAGQLPLNIGGEVRMRSHHQGWVLISRVGDRCHTEGWCPKDQLSIWEVCAAFKPLEDWPDRQSFLELRAEDTILVQKRYNGEWEGWAHGIKWGSAKQGQGVFPLLHAVPHLLLS